LRDEVAAEHPQSDQGMLNKLRRYRPAILIAVLFVVVAYEEWSSITAHDQKSPDVPQTNQPSTAAQDKPSVFLTLEAWADARHDAIEAIAAIVSASFAIILTGSTIGLWIVTRTAAKAAKAAAEVLPMTERAYVFGGPGFRIAGEDGHPIVRYTIGNYGKTPAFLETITWSFTPEPFKEEASRSGSDVLLDVLFGGDTKPSTIHDIRFPVLHDRDFVFFARVTFADIFGTARWSESRHRLKSPNWDLEPLEGNARHDGGK
jgi:hypothetical protein